MNFIEELKTYIRNDSKLLGEVFVLSEDGVQPKEMVSQGVAANVAVVYQNKQMLRAILERELPTSSAIALYAARGVSRLIKSNPEMTHDCLAYLDALSRDLRLRAEDAQAVIADQATLAEVSETLAKRVRDLSEAIYVYSFPTYLHFGKIDDSDVKWLKIGTTRNAVWQRIVDQSRQTSMPEDPVLVRVYHREGADLASIERKFHKTLLSVGHEQGSATRVKAGTEWFATTEEALDALADLMGLEIETSFTFDN
jgi:hypothetical protein